MLRAVVEEAGKHLIMHGEDRLRFHAIWLRDNAWDDGTRSKQNGQRLISLSEIPKNITVGNARIDGNQLTVTFQPEDKTVAYDIDWLMRHAYDRDVRCDPGWTDAQIKTWNADLSDRVPDAQFDEVCSDNEALRIWLSNIKRFGFAKLSDGPTTDLSLLKVVELFGYVRETNYGKHFEVRTEVNPTNLAFTGSGLQAHTDNPYRDPVPTVQVLYCLESSAEGGESMVVDGFAVAQRLRDEKQDWFDVLCRYCARFEYAGSDGVMLQSRKPMIELAPDGELVAVRFNNRSAAAITDVPFEDMDLYYDAYRRMAEIIDESSMQVAFRLSPGDSFLLDNTRVLHARKAFSSNGTRWLQGCYADKDALYSRLSVLNERLDKIA